MYGHPTYSLNEPGHSIEVPVTYEKFFNSDFGICPGGKYISGGYYRPIRMNKLWRVIEIG